MRSIESSLSAIVMITVRVIAPLLFVSGFVSVLSGLAIAAVLGVGAGVWLFLSGILAVVLAQIIELMQQIERDLAAVRARLDTGVLDDISTELAGVRAQIGKGMLGLLGM